MRGKIAESEIVRCWLYECWVMKLIPMPDLQQRAVTLTLGLGFDITVTGAQLNFFSWNVGGLILSGALLQCYVNWIRGVGGGMIGVSKHSLSWGLVQFFT